MPRTQVLLAILLAFTALAFAQATTGASTYARLVKFWTGEDLSQIHLKAHTFQPSAPNPMVLHWTEAEGLVKVETVIGGALRATYGDGTTVLNYPLSYCQFGPGQDEVEFLEVLPSYSSGAPPIRQQITWRQ